MNLLVYHVVSGHAFFSGAFLLLIAVATSTSEKKAAKRATVAMSLLGVAFVVLSAVAIPYWCYIVWAFSAIGWAMSYFRKDIRRWGRAVFVAMTIAAVLCEIPYHIYWGLGTLPDRRVTVIADSITAGMGSSDRSGNWPHLLARDRKLDVQDLSEPGETAGSALKHLDPSTVNGSLVIVEIGGNDLLGSTTAAQFASDLNELLLALKGEGRQILMLELPLPPLKNEFGRIQRTLARRHGVVLVPKRVLLNILAPSDNTLDTIHLTDRGQKAMADSIWSLISHAYN